MRRFSLTAFSGSTFFPFPLPFPPPLMIPSNGNPSPMMSSRHGGLPPPLLRRLFPNSFFFFFDDDEDACCPGFASPQPETAPFAQDRALSNSLASSSSAIGTPGRSLTGSTSALGKLTRWDDDVLLLDIRPSSASPCGRFAPSAVPLSSSVVVPETLALDAMLAASSAVVVAGESDPHVIVILLALGAVLLLARDETAEGSATVVEAMAGNRGSLLSTVSRWSAVMARRAAEEAAGVQSNCSCSRAAHFS